MDARFELLEKWLADLEVLQSVEFTTPTPASSDASFRRYFRIELASSEDLPQSLIIMDAPPEQEDSRPFIKISQQLADLGINVPQVFAQDLELGFLLLGDLGSQTYLSVLNDDNADALYGDSLRDLLIMQTRAATQGLPVFDKGLYAFEVDLFTSWLGEKYCNLAMSSSEKSDWAGAVSLLIDNALAQPQAFVHRDYHSRNLMFLSEKNPGILDFQDALLGPITYDFISLTRDCYKVWDGKRVDEWMRQYFLDLVAHNLASKSEWDSFVRAADLMGVQRHIKAAGIFARLYLRDGKANYLPDVMPTLNYIVEVAGKYPELTSLARWTENLALRFNEVKR